MNQSVVQVDAFASSPFTGNPAAVCILSEQANDSWMQAVAMEMNLAETAFLLHGGTHYILRWFTPTTEVELCGHATLAAAHVLWEAGTEPTESPIQFSTLSGLLSARRIGDWIQLDFPAERATLVPAPATLLPSLGIEADSVEFVGKNRFDYIVQVNSARLVRSLVPDITELGRISCRGVIVTAKSDSAEYDFISRFFAPAAGVPEDPVTGSAHCCLAPYWSTILGQTELVGYQASRRGGIIRVVVTGDRVLLHGKAVTTMRGELSETACRPLD